MAENPRRTSAGPLANGFCSPRRQRSSISATPGQGDRVVPLRKGSVPMASELRNLGAGTARGSTTSLPGVMGMMAMGHTHGSLGGSASAGTAGPSGAGVPLNFAGIFAQQFFNKQLDDDLVTGRYS